MLEPGQEGFQQLFPLVSGCTAMTSALEMSVLDEGLVRIMGGMKHGLKQVFLHSNW